MNVELEIISNIVDKKDMRAAIKLGITADFFRTSLGKDAWNWLMTEYQKPETQGEVPDKTRLKRQFPDFDYRPTTNSLKALHLEAKDLYLIKDTQEILAKLQTMLDDGFDAKTVILDAIDHFKQVQSSEIQHDGYFMHNVTDELWARYERREQTDGVIGLPYPYDCLNAMTAGMCPGDLVYIYGRPGMMKSWLLCVVAAHLATLGKRVMMYTKEIDDITLIERVASIILGIEYSPFRSGHLNAVDKQAYKDFLEFIKNEDKSNIFVVTDKGCKNPRTVMELMSIAERIAPDVLFIDGFYLLNAGKLNSTKSDHEKIKAISRDIKGFAQSLGIPVICTSQANRDGKKNANVGETEDAAFSDAVGQDADVMLRCFKGPHPTELTGNSLLVVPKKVREGGAEGTPKAFIINANPSYDWTLQQFPADPKQFFRDMEAAETAAGPRQQGAQSNPFKKVKKVDNGPFRE